jgi:hypothetical protein
MPIESRIEARGDLHHIIARVIERTKIFQDDTDQNHFLERLGENVLNPCGEKTFQRGSFVKIFYSLLFPEAYPSDPLAAHIEFSGNLGQGGPFASHFAERFAGLIQISI